MTLIIRDRVRDITHSVGTSTLLLNDTPPTGFRSFSSVTSIGDTIWYTIQQRGSGEWEIGLGTMVGANSLARTQVYSSSNGGALVSFTPGIKDVFSALPASKHVWYTGGPIEYVPGGGGGGGMIPLAPGHIYVGNGSSIAADFGTYAAFTPVNNALTLLPGGGPTYGLALGQVLSGTAAGGQFYSTIFNIVDEVDWTSSGFIDFHGVGGGLGVYIQYDVTGGIGGRCAFYVNAAQTGPTTGLNSDVTGLASIAFASDTDVGGTISVPRGHYWGGLFASGSTTAVPYMNSTIGIEVDSAITVGSSVVSKVGILIAQIHSDAVAGSLVDTAIRIANQAGAVGWKDAILLDNDYEQAMQSTGTILRTQGAWPLGSGIDMSSVSISNYFLRGPTDSFRVHGTGKTRFKPSTGTGGELVIDSIGVGNYVGILPFGPAETATPNYALAAFGADGGDKGLYINRPLTGDIHFKEHGVGTDQLTILAGGDITVNKLKTTAFPPPATTGTVKMVICDDNGLLSFDDVPSGGGGMTALAPGHIYVGDAGSVAADFGADFVFSNTSHLFTANALNKSQLIAFPSFDGQSYQGGHSILISADGSATGNPTGLVVQVQNTSATPNAGALVALTGGILNQLNGTDGGAVVGYAANSNLVTDSSGAAIWGIARRTGGKGQTTVTGLRSTSETGEHAGTADDPLVDGTPGAPVADHPYAGVAVGNSTSTNAWVKGVAIHSAHSVGLQIGCDFTDPSFGLDSVKTPATPILYLGQSARSTSSSISGTTLTVGGTITGVIEVGQLVYMGGIAANTYITALGTGTGGAGTYTVSVSQTIGPLNTIFQAAARFKVQQSGGIYVRPDGSGGELLIDRVGPGNYVGIYPHGSVALAGSQYAIAADGTAADPDLYINRPTGGDIHFKENLGADQVTILPGGIVRISSLDTDLTAPTPSGTTKMVITDANGQLSFDNIPSGTGGVTDGDKGDVIVSGGGATWLLDPTISKREIVSTARTYYVNNSTGSDSNTGLSSGTAFATIQKAVDVVCDLIYWKGVSPNISVAKTGIDYDEFVTLRPWYGSSGDSGAFYNLAGIHGDPTDSTYTTGVFVKPVGGTGGEYAVVKAIGPHARWFWHDISVDASAATGAGCYYAFGGATLHIYNGDLGIATGGNSQIQAVGGSEIHWDCNYPTVSCHIFGTIGPDTQTLITSYQHSFVHMNVQVIFDNDPGYWIVFWADQHSDIQLYHNCTFSGVHPVGQRVKVREFSRMHTSFATLASLPGDSWTSAGYGLPVDQTSTFNSHGFPAVRTFGDLSLITGSAIFPGSIVTITDSPSNVPGTAVATGGGAHTVPLWYTGSGWVVLAPVASAGITDGDKGDITVSGSGATWTIDNDVVTYAKMQNVSAVSKLLGRGDSGAPGDPQEITLGTNLTMSGTTLNASGGGGSPGGSTKQVQYNNTGAFDGAAGFLIEGAGEEPAIASGKSLLYQSAGTPTTFSQVLSADVDKNNSYLGGAGNFTATGTGNHGAGFQALLGLTSGSNNLAAGLTALYNNTSGEANVAIGSAALYANTIGNQNVALGQSALTAATSATGNMAIGATALFATTTGGSNVGIGARSLFNNTIGVKSIAVGYEALFGNIDGEGNIGIGTSVGFANQHGAHNIYIGYITGQASTGTNNICIGYAGGSELTSGDNNIILAPFIGAATGGVTTGSRNIVIGADNAVATNTASNQLVIGNYIYGTGLSGAGTTISTGKIGIGIKAPAYELDVAGQTGTTGVQFKGTTSGIITMFSDTGTWNFKLPTTAGTANHFLQTDGSGNTTWAAAAGGSGSPGGSNKQVQYNNSSVFGGAASFTIESGEPCIAAGKSLLYGSSFAPVLNADPSKNNSWLGGAGNFSVSGTGNHGAGYNALHFLTSGTNNLAGGVSAMQSETTGSNNVAIGSQAMLLSINSQGCVALGASALGGGLGGNSNIAVGGAALELCNGGGGNTALGASAINRLTTGNDNIGVGFNSLSHELTGSGNVAIGPGALRDQNNGLGGTYGSIGVGISAGLLVTNGYGNCLIGTNAASSLTTGFFNTVIGSVAPGGGLATGNYNTLIGNTTGLGAALSNAVVIADGQGNTRFDYNFTTAGRTTIHGGGWNMRLPTSAGTSGHFLQTDGAGVTTWAAASGSGSPGGSDTQVQYNNAGTFGGAANWTHSGGNLNIVSGGQLLYNNSQIIQAQTALGNFYEGGSGNLTGTGTFNLGTGSGALVSITSGDNNTAVGAGAAANILTGTANFALGGNSLSGNTGGSNNIAIGKSALQNGTNPVDCIGIGGNSLFVATGALNAVAIGNSSQGSVTSGPYNTSIGYQALRDLVSGGYNVAIGMQAMYGCTGDQNIAIGTLALGPMTSGTRNIGIGTSTGGGITTGGGNTIIGHGIAGLSSSLTDSVIIGVGNNTIVLDYNKSTASAWTFKDAGATWNFRLPTTNGTSGHFLQTDGSGNTSWAAGGGGGMLALATSHIYVGDGSNAAVDFGANITITGAGTLNLLGGVSAASPTPMLTLGSYQDSGGDVSLSHLSLFGNSYGFGISSSSLNYITGGSAQHAFYQFSDLATPLFRITPTALIATSLASGGTAPTTSGTVTMVVSDSAGLLSFLNAANAKTALGLGTTDSPQFAAINHGNASDTTVARQGAGVLAVEGKMLYSTGTVALTDGATPALDAALGSTFTLSAAGDRTIAVPSNPQAGQKIVIAHTASGANRTLALNTGAGGFRFGTDVTGLTLTTSGLTDYIGAIYNATASRWDVVAYVKGY